MSTPELELYNASQAGDVGKVKAVLTAAPTVDVNKQNRSAVRDDRLKHTASSYGDTVLWCRETTQR